VRGGRCSVSMIAGPTPTPEYYRPIAFGIGRAMSRAIDVLFGNFVVFIAISALAAVPLFLFALAPMSGFRSYVAIAGLLLHFVFSALASAMIVFATFQALRARPVRAGESIARGLQRLGPVLLTSIVTGIIVAVGTFLLIIPGLIASVIMCVAIPACVVERLNPIESIERSSYLSRGQRWPIFGAFFAIGILSIIASAIITALTKESGSVWLAPAISLVWNTLVTAYQTVLVAIIYHDLRVVKDGIDLEHIAAVFD
jgi:hypothetical protein